MARRDRFWDIPPSSKIDILNDREHFKIIVWALADRETRIYKTPTNTFVLYGPEEALGLDIHFKPLLFVIRIYYHLLSIRHPQ